MLKEVQRVNRIVEELLALASPRKLELSKVNLHRILGDILTLQKRAAEEQEYHLPAALRSEHPAILADEALLTQLFLNLVKNAVEAVGESGTVQVTSRVVSDYSMTQNWERRSRMVAVDVTDDGPGIARGAAGRDLHPVLHHQDERNRPRPRHLPEDRLRTPRHDQGRFGPAKRDDLHRHAAFDTVNTGLSCLTSNLI